MSPQPPIAPAISRALAAEVRSRTTWDELPCLYTIRVQAGRCHLQAVPIPLALWTIGRPPDILASIAQAAGFTSLVPDARHPGGLYGAAFRFEGWGVDIRGLDAAQRREAEADSAAHRIRARPDRIEYRLILAADRTGMTYSARQQRGDAQVFTDTLVPGSHLHHRGQVIAALQDLTAALAGSFSHRPDQAAAWPQRSDVR